MNKVLIEKMSWKEFAEAMIENDLVIIPVGAVEEHGLHSPLGSDSIIAEACARKIGEKIGVPVASVMPFGYCPTVKNFPGSISIDPYLLRKILVLYAGSYVRHGAKRILFISGHSRNADILELVGTDLYDKYGAVATYTQWRRVLPKLNKKWTCDDHGGYFETSMLMAIRPDIVDIDKIKIAEINGLTESIVFKNGWNFKGTSLYFPVDIYNQQRIESFEHIPFIANRELGIEMINAYVDFNVGLINELRKIEI